MYFIVVTAAVFQAEMSWLKAVAYPNMAYIDVTAAVFQAEMSWLKAAEPSVNIDPIVVTCDVSHDPIAVPFPSLQSTNDDEQSHAPVASAERQLMIAALRLPPLAKGAARARSGAIEIATSAPTSAATRGA